MPILTNPNQALLDSISSAELASWSSPQRDHYWMQRALKLAANGRFTTNPNPRVGAVIVKDNQLLGEGYHHQAGQPHAEVFALAKAGVAAQGATCYVTLEPCSHYGRTPPCAEALIKAQVARVVIAQADPNPLVNGHGIAMLRAAGIEVDVGVMAEQAIALNPGFLSVMARQQPWWQIKQACSLDGKLALANGESQWITSPAAREDVQRFRAMACAIVSTSQTVLADDATLTVRANEITPLLSGELRQPVRVILDRRARLTGNESLFRHGGKVMLLTAPGVQSPVMENNTVQVEIIFAQLQLNEQGFFALSALNALLLQHGLHTIWVEAGAQLCSQLWHAGMVDEYIVYQAPMLLGANAQAMMVAEPWQQLSNAPRWQWQEVSVIGPDLRLRAVFSDPTLAQTTLQKDA